MERHCHLDQWFIREIKIGDFGGSGHDYDLGDQEAWISFFPIQDQH